MFRNKIFFILVLIALLWVPVGVIHNLVIERAEQNHKVQQEISNSTSGAQTIIGPVLVQQLELRKHIGANQIDDSTQWQLTGAEQLQVRSDAQVEQRSRGLYRVRVYQSKHQLQADFAAQAALPSEFAALPAPQATPLQPSSQQHAPQRRRVDSYLAFAIGDVRGLSTLPIITIDGTPREVIAGSGLKGAPEGIRVAITAEELQRGFHVEMQFDLQGSRSLSVIPSANSSQWQLQSNWRDPAFNGRFLPTQRDLNEQGFAAKWQSTQLSNPTLQALLSCVTETHCALAAQGFHVDLIEAVDPYQQNERAIKYAILVIVLSFAWFYVAEILQRAPLHMMQYGLVGLALVMFYLLLISLSEVVGFMWAYVMASSACAALLLVYLSGALQSLRRASALAGAYALLQALLYLILQAETFALLSGSLLLFSTLAVLMIATRHIDWHQLLNNTPASSASYGDLASLDNTSASQHSGKREATASGHTTP
jgi:inner membrane protein